MGLSGVAANLPFLLEFRDDPCYLIVIQAEMFRNIGRIDRFSIVLPEVTSNFPFGSVIRDIANLNLFYGQRFA